MHAIETGLRPTFNIPEDVLRNLYYVEGKTIEEIAENYGVTKPTVIRQMDKYELKRRIPKEMFDKYHIDLNMLLSDFEHGIKNKELAKKYNCPATLIARRKYQFRKRGLLNG